MNWVKTYESYIYESMKVDIENFEKAIAFQKGTGIITGIDYDMQNKVLTITTADKLSSFDLGGLMNAIDKKKKDIKKEYSGVKQLHVGNTVISI
jgi:hypothetical protein